MFFSLGKPGSPNRFVCPGYPLEGKVQTSKNKHNKEIQTPLPLGPIFVGVRFIVVDVVLLARLK